MISIILAIIATLTTIYAFIIYFTKKETQDEVCAHLLQSILFVLVSILCVLAAILCK
jgi:hypothetical protein